MPAASDRHHAGWALVTTWVLAATTVLATFAAAQEASTTQRAAAWEQDLAHQPLALADSLALLAEELLNAGSYQQVLPYCQRVLELRTAQLGPDALPVASAHDLLSWCYDGLRDVEANLSHMQRAADIFRLHLQPGDPQLAFSLLQLGHIHYTLQDPATAAVVLQEALDGLLSVDEPDHATIVWAQSDLAEMNRLLGNFDLALQLQRAAVDRSRQHLPANGLRATLLGNLGVMYWDQDRLDDAERCYREALEVVENDPEARPTTRPTAYMNLGVLTNDQDEPESAIPLLQKALELAEQNYAADDPALALFYLELGKVKGRLGDWTRAIELWQQALEVLDRAPVPHRVFHALVLDKIGWAHLAAGAWSPAEDSFRQAVALRQQAHGLQHPDVGVSLTGLATALHEGREGEDESAEAFELADRAATILQQETLSPEVRAEAFALRATLLWQRQQKQRAKNDLQQALELVEQLRPLRGGSDLTRARFLEKFAGYYNKMIAWLVEEGDLHAALDHAERIRARVLRDQLAAQQVDLRHGIPREVLAPLEAKERAARQRIASAQKRITWEKTHWAENDEAAAARLNELEAELQAATREFRDAAEQIKLASPQWEELLRREQSVLDVARVQRELLRPDELLLLYQIGQEGSFVFVLPASGELTCHALTVDSTVAQAFELQDGSLGATQLAAMLAGPTGVAPGVLQELRGVTGVAPVQDSAPNPKARIDAHERMRWLRSTLIPEAVWQQVRQARAVVVIPDGALHALPFEALVTNIRGDRPVYWLDEGPPLRYGHGLSSLLALQERSESRERMGQNPFVLSVSDPVFDPIEVATSLGSDAGAPLVAMAAPEPEVSRLRGAQGTLPSLPGTAAETEAIRAAFPAGAVRVLQKLQANEVQVRQQAPAARYLHLATHGIVQADRSDLLAALALTPPPPEQRSSSEDGFLHLFEIYELELASDMAVLSACETKLGERIDGEGVFALSRGFLAAGADRTVASLWPVADESTAVLIGEFFRGIANAEAEGGPVDYTSLLRDAKKAVRSHPKWSDPFFWAPFVLSGAP